MCGSLGMGGHLGLTFGCVSVKDCLFDGAWRIDPVWQFYTKTKRVRASLRLDATFSRSHEI